MPVMKKRSFELLPLLFIHKAYCWQVALQQSLLPLQLYANKLPLFFLFVTNYFWHHYHKKVLENQGL
jgi:hypothetical protein